MTHFLRTNFIKEIAIKLNKNAFLVKSRNQLTVCDVMNTFRYINTSSVVFGAKGIAIKMPSLSPTMSEGTIVKWLKREGDKISAGDVLCEVQTDKAIVGLELEEEGILAKIIVGDDTKDIKIGALIAVMVEEGQDWKNVDMPSVADQTSDSTQTSASPQSASKPLVKSDDHIKDVSSSKHSLISPTARNLLHQYGIDSQAITSSGPRNTLLKDDVLQYIKTHDLKAKTSEELVDHKTSRKDTTSKLGVTAPQYVDIELSNMRKTIAKRLTQSKSTIPHSYMSVNCFMTEVTKMRQKLKLSGLNISVNDFIIKAAAVALKKVPQINSSWIESTSSIQLLSSIDISVAVATPNGLITPIVKNSNQLSLTEINKTVKQLADRARDGKLQPHEFIGGSFSLSNLGMFGITEFSAVINPPQSAILAIGGSRLILDDSEQLRQVVTVTLSYDCRVFDEDLAAKFLETFKNTIEDPVLLETSDGSDNRRLNFLVS